MALWRAQTRNEVDTYFMGRLDFLNGSTFLGSDQFPQTDQHQRYSTELKMEYSPSKRSGSTAHLENDGLDLVFARETKMNASINELPWSRTPVFVECNFAFGHLVQNLPRRLTVDGRIHAETYISAVGAIAGYAAQRTLFAETPPMMGVNINRVGTKSGDHYWFGDSLNNMLVPKTETEAGRCLWSLAAGSAVAAGLQERQLPKLDAMFKYVSAKIGGVDEGKSSVAPEHQAHIPARDLLKIVWPLAIMCFSGKLPGASREFGAVPIAWWSAVAARAATRPIHDVKNALSPEIALTLLMESAIYSSKLDQSVVEQI